MYVYRALACVAGGFVHAGSKRLAVKPPQRAAKPRLREQNQPLPPHSSRGFTAKTFDQREQNHQLRRLTESGLRKIIKQKTNWNLFTSATFQGSQGDPGDQGDDGKPGATVSYK